MPHWRLIERHNRDQLGEGPLWSARDQALYWVDILSRKLHRLRLEDEHVDSWTLPEMTGWVIERRDHPGFIAGLRSGFAELALEPFSIRPIISPEPHLPTNRLNDAKADAAGRIYAGSMPIDADEASGSLYRLDADHTITRLDTGYFIANGPAFSADERWLYHTDTGRGVIYRFPMDPDGSVGPRSHFIHFPDDWGKPDGMTVDADDHLWVAHWGGSRVSRFSPQGVLERSIALPTPQITSCAFAGPDLDRLFVTSAAVGRAEDPLAGRLFEVNPRARGLTPCSFAG